ncbi:MAG: hypothetical protein NVSMB66_1900 [Candidatus Doudnabacteria bacterium]
MISGDVSLTPKTIGALVLAGVVILLLIFYQFRPDFSFNSINYLATNSECTTDQACNPTMFPAGDTVGSCRNCVTIKKTRLPIMPGIGDYVDARLVQKLIVLKKLNSNWRLTEVYPPTVRHLSFCHQNGTCVDLGLSPEKKTAANLSQLCIDALKAQLTITDEYSDPNLFTADTACPPSNIFETTTGGHLHVE